MSYLKSFAEFFISRSDRCTPEIIHYIHGLLGGERRRKNMERMEEIIPGFSYENVQHTICDAPWSARAVMDEVARRAAGLLGGGPRPRLVLDDSATQKKGGSSVGVARQYCGRLGKVENCQVAVCASLASGQRSTLVDMRLYLPEAWCQDPARCDKARVPAEARTLRSKAELALEIVRHQRALGTPFAIVSMDSGYGSNGPLLAALDADGETYVAEIHSDTYIWEEHPWPHRQGARPGRELKAPRPSAPGERVDAWAQRQEESQWQRLKVRNSDRGWVEVSTLARRVWVMHEGEAFLRWLLIWENPDESINNGRPAGQRIKRHYALSNAPADSDERQLIGDALGRNVVERDFRDAKSEAGMSDYQVRGWTAWHHHMALVMMAMLFLLQERMHQGAVESREGPVNITAGDITFMIGRLMPMRGRGAMDETQAIAQLTARISKRVKDQERRRRKTRETRPEPGPLESLEPHFK